MRSRSLNTALHVLLVFSFLISLFGVTPATPAHAAGRCYVNDNAGGSNDGSSWADAYTSLQSAIANSCTEIWVAAGTYKPDASDRAISFNLESGTAIYGGFAGTEALRSERNYVANITILSGDLNGNDNATISTSEPTRSENSYHVVYANAVDNSAILDGFTITGGNANTLLPDGSIIHLKGGGMSNVTSNPTLMNLTFNSNSANGGGGMYNDSSNPALTNVTFSGNFASSGGGMYNSSSSPTLTNATFSGNSVTAAGGGMYVSSGSPILTNVTFSGNSASEGGGMYNLPASPSLTNVTISGNLNGGLYMVTATGVYLKNVIIANNTGYDCSRSKGSLNASYSLIENSSYACGLTDGVNGNIIGSDPKLGSLTGSPAYFPLETGSPAINVGTNTGCPAADQRGAPRPQDANCDIGSVEAPAAGTILYAKPGATGTGSCLDWANACMLQTAISVANSGNDIWVMQGTHKPHVSDRTVSFNLESGVEIYGGFAGTETLLSQRNPASNTTILSGDLSGNDNATISYNEPTRSENSYHVVYANAVDNSAVLDGFTITGGNAYGAVDTPYQNGGGMYTLSSNPTITNITFNGNSAAFIGGGMYNYTSSPTLTHVTFSGNSGVTFGGGMYNEYSNPTLTNVTFSTNFSYNEGGGMYNTSSEPILSNVTFSGNSVSFAGGGMYNETSNPTLTHVTFSGNSAIAYGGGMFNTSSSPTLTHVTFSGNSANQFGGGMSNLVYSNPIFTNVTFSDNSAIQGGGMYNDSGSPALTNSTFSNNDASEGGGMYNHGSSPTLTNVTFSGNSADPGKGVLHNSNSSSPILTNVIIANSTNSDCILESFTTINATSSNNLIESTGASACNITATSQGGGNIIGSDPDLDTLTGSPAYFPLNAGSPAINAGTNTGCPSTSQNGVARPAGSRCDIGSTEAVFNIDVTISSVSQGTYALAPGSSKRVNYAGLDAGPVVVDATNNAPIIAALREAYYVSGQIESFVQLMGLPAESLSTTYYFPAYNNVTLDDQLRFGNVGNSATTVTVTIAGVVRGTYNLNPGEAKRVNYAGLDAGPVVVQSSGGVPIIAALRDAYYVDGRLESFAQLMGLPQEQLSTTYNFPAYNNVSLDGQLRFGNVGNASTTVTVTIAGVVRGTYNLNPSEAKRVNYVGLDAGPVVIQSSGGVPIIAALRDAYFVNGKVESFAQLMGLPQEFLSSAYYFPAYNNVTLDGQLRFGVP